MRSTYEALKGAGVREIISVDLVGKGMENGIKIV
jgi:hypothetical protein